MTMHTPGPWQSTRNTYKSTHGRLMMNIVVDPLGSRSILLAVASRNEDTTEVRANAELVAAAPDMFEALQRAEFILSSPSLSRMADCVGGLTAVRAALAKARGEE